MTSKEEDILAAIEEAKKERQEARTQLDRLKRALLDAESDLIAANLRLERLKEELRVYRNTTPRHDPTQREQDIEAFRAKMEDYKKRGLL